MTYPENYRYTKQHQWVRLEAEVATIGLTFYAQKSLGDIVYVDLPKAGTRLEAGKTLGSVESVKAVSDIYSPLSGEVIEVNEALGDTPEKLNEDPHGAAWLIRLRVENAGEMSSLMSAADYQVYAGAES